MRNPVARLLTVAILFTATAICLGQTLPTVNGKTPLFSFGVFYQGDLEIHPASGLTLSNRVHSNSNLWHCPNALLTFAGDVSTTGRLINSRHTNDPNYSGSCGNTVFNASATTNVHPYAVIRGVNNTTTLRELIKRPPSGEAPTSEPGLDRYYNKAELLILLTNNVTTWFPTNAPVLGTTNALTTNFMASTPRMGRPGGHVNLTNLNFIAVAAKTPYSASSNVIALIGTGSSGMTFSNSALQALGGTNIYFIAMPGTNHGTNWYVTNYNGVAGNPLWSYGVTTNLHSTLVASGTTYSTFGTNHMLGGTYCFLSLTNQFVDQRENSKIVRTVDINVGALMKWSTNDQTMQGAITAQSPSNAGHPVNLVYISDARTNGVGWTAGSTLYAVRVTNAETVGSRGLTIATENPLYTHGNFNVTSWKPASLVGDSLTVLSAHWNDASGAGSYTARIPTTLTTINAAIAVGNVPTTATEYSGGLHNLARYLEHWSGRTVTLKGSLVCLWDSVKATNEFINVGQTGSYYSTPVRNFIFDTNFLQLTSLPPGTPSVFYNTTAIKDVFTAFLNTPLVIEASILTSNDLAHPANWPNTNLTVTAATNTGPYGTAVLSNGQITYTPHTNFQGTDTFSYTITDTAGYSTNGIVTVNVVAPAGISAHPQSQTVAYQGNATLSVTATGAAPFSYQWRFNGTDIFGATNSSLSLTNLQTAQGGNYQVVITNAYGAITSSIAALSVVGPIPAVEWQKTFGASLSDSLPNASRALNGNYVIAGYAEPGVSSTKNDPGFGTYDYWAVKLDANANKVWDYAYGGDQDDLLADMQLTADGGCIMAGYTYRYTFDSPLSGNKTSTNFGAEDIWVVKVDALGNKEWDQTLGTTTGEYGNSVQQTFDGGYIVGGSTGPTMSGNRTAPAYGDVDYWIIKLNAAGNILWDRTFGGSQWDTLSTVRQTSDGGYILGGRTASSVSGNKTSPYHGGFTDGWLVKVDENGNKVWDKAFGGSNADSITSVEPTSDGGYLIGLRTDSGISGNKTMASHGGDDFWVIKLDSDGEKIWEQAWGGSGEDVLADVCETTDGYLIGGRSNSGASGNKGISSYGGDDFWLLKLDISGNKFWETSFGGSENDWIRSLQSTPDGGILIGGHSFSGISGNKTNLSFGDADYWVIKLVGTSTPPVIMVHPEDQSFLYYGDTYLTVAATGTEPFFYQWYQGVSGDISFPILDATNNILAGYNITNSVDIWVRVNNPTGQADSETAHMAVMRYFHLDVDGDGYGSAAQPPIEAETLPPGYAESSDDCDDYGNTIYPSAPEIMDGVDNNCDGTIDEGWLPIITMQPQSLTNYPGLPAFFQVEVANPWAVTDYQWQCNNVDTPSARSDIFFIMELDSSQVGDYQVIIRNAYGSVTSAVVRLELYTLTTAYPDSFAAVPNVPLSFAAPALTLNDVASTANGTNTNLTVNAVFSPSAQGGVVSLLNGQITYTPSYHFSGSDTFGYSIVDSVGGEDTGTVTIMVGAPPAIVSQPVGQTVPQGTNVSLSVTATGSDLLLYQWRFNETNIPGATSSVLNFTKVHLTNEGTYSVAITNSAGFVISSNALLSVIPDTNGPTLTITSPKGNLETNASSLLFTGTAKDKIRVAAVLLQLNGGEWNSATLTGPQTNVSWSQTLDLTAGTNTALVKAVDYAGNETAIQKRVIFYRVLQQLTVSITGDGTTLATTNAFGAPVDGAWLQVGRSYRIKAIPAATDAFSNWTGSVSTSTNLLNFIMQSNMVLNANFIPNPFIPAAGSYSGLFFETNSVKHHSSGFINLKLKQNFSFSGKLLLDGDSISLSGKFNLDGTFSKTLSRAKIGKSDLQLSLTLDFSNGSDQLSGTVAVNGSWTAPVTADRKTFGLTNNATAYATNYTLLIPGLEDPASGPSGYSCATIIVTTNGMIKPVGAFADGLTFSQSAEISKNGDWPFYLPLYKTKRIYTNLIATTNLASPKLGTNTSYTVGSALGWLTFTNDSIVGNVSWIKGTWTNQIYPNGFTNVTEVIASRYTAPPKGTPAMTTVNGTVLLTDGNLSSALNRNFTLSPNNVITITPTNQLVKLTLTVKSGLLKGSFRHPDNTNKVTTLTGAVLQQQDFGGGYFLGTNQAGGFRLNTE